MSRAMLPYVALMLLGVFVSAVAQVLLKKAAMRPYDSFWQQYLNLPVIIAYAIFFAATFMSIFAYKAVPLSMGAILEATGYIYVTVFGVTIFGERISARQVLALALIIGGIAVYSFLG